MSSTRASSRRGKRQRLDQELRPAQDPGSGPDSGVPSGTQSKVAIPRIQNDSLAHGTPKRRIKHACVTCQQQKARCSGEQPQCHRCLQLNLECNYSMGKRDSDRQYARIYEQLKEQNNQAVSLLSVLRSRSNPEDQQIIQTYLDSWNEATPSTAATEQSIDKTDPVPDGTGSTRASEGGSQGSIDVLDEDIESNERTRATGYLGKSSDIRWWRRATTQNLEHKEEPSEAPDPNSISGEPGTLVIVPGSRAISRKRSLIADAPLSAVSYHLDDLELRTTSAIDAYEMPTSGVSHKLFEYYKSNVHVEFPFVDVDWVANCVSEAILEPQHRAKTQAGSRERAIINIVFAIGASYAHLIDGMQGDDQDHLLYYTRARILGLEVGSFVDHPNLQVVQLAALTGFYYLCSSQINRAWMVTGYSIRAAFALGLHIRNEDTALLPATKETRLRLWWALWLLERQLVSLSGRPTGIQDNTCSVLRPSEGFFTGDKSATSQGPLADPYLSLRIDLAKITQSAIDLLYSPSVDAKSWGSVQGNIETLEHSLQQWRDRVPATYDFNTPETDSKSYTRATQTLGHYFYMTRILITRPCLSGFGRQMKLTKDSSKFNLTKAGHCIVAAGHAIDLLPNSFDPVDLYRNGPWYAQVSFIMQACAIIMLEISLGASHSSSTQYLTSQIERPVRWLYEMAKRNTAAYRAWSQCTKLLTSFTLRIGIGIDVSSINMTSPEIDPVSERRHHSMSSSIYGVDIRRGGVAAGEYHQASATLASMGPYVQQPELQPLPVLDHTEAPLFDPGIGFEGAWQNNDFFGFDPSLMDLIEPPFAPAENPLTVDPNVVISSALDKQQTGATIEQQRATAHDLNWEEIPEEWERQ